MLSISPLITVITCSYNAGQYLADSVQSVLQQTYPHWELLLIDDGSTDNSIEPIEQLQDARIRIIRHAQNRGIAVSRKEGIELASGKYCCWLDADDIALPNRLQQQVSWLEQHPDTVLCTMQAHIINEQGQWQQQPAPGINDAALKAAMFFRFPFINSTVAMPTAAARQAVDTSIDYKQAEDYILYSRLMQSGCFVCLPHAGIGYRIHQSAHRITDDRNNADIVHGRMIAWRIILQYLQLQTSDEVLEVHDKITYYRNRITKANALHFNGYLQLLANMKNANRHLNIFEIKSFEAGIVNRMYSTLLHSALSLKKAIALGWQFRDSLGYTTWIKLSANRLRRLVLQIED